MADNGSAIITSLYGGKRSAADSAEVLEYLQMELECEPSRSYAEAINTVFEVIAPQRAEGERALMLLATACCDHIPVAARAECEDELRRDLGRMDGVAIRRAITRADAYFAGREIAAAGETQRSEVVAAALSSARAVDHPRCRGRDEAQEGQATDTIEAKHTTTRRSGRECAACGERFEGDAELVRAVLESHACASAHGVRPEPGN